MIITVPKRRWEVSGRHWGSIFGRRLMSIVEFLIAVQRPGKVFVYHVGDVASIVGEHHAIYRHVLRVCGGTPVPARS